MFNPYYWLKLVNSGDKLYVFIYISMIWFTMINHYYLPILAILTNDGLHFQEHCLYYQLWTYENRIKNDQY